MCYCWPKSLSGCNRQHANTSCSFRRWVVGCSNKKGTQTVFRDFSGWPVRTVTVCNAIPSSWLIPQVPQCCIPTCADVSICDALLAEHADLLVHNAKTSLLPCTKTVQLTRKTLMDPTTSYLPARTESPTAPLSCLPESAP